ncbi:hypothetical protein [Acuticoccus mangrovi]|uniref:hypothetical protein n=1 Tax=Acuticoccus mangrovi TaxID=2796142 RepID=UPI001E48609E|nr:hypothetical protein [Acuticoccus mangrovi]
MTVDEMQYTMMGPAVSGLRQRIVGDPDKVPIAEEDPLDEIERNLSIAALQIGSALFYVNHIDVSRKKAYVCGPRIENKCPERELV